jgi:hypothetical protein
MKKIFKLTSVALLLFLSVSCTEDDQMIASPSGGPELLNPESGAAYVLAPENASSDLVTLVWDHADYSVQTVVNYELQVALAGSSFETPVSAGTTTNRYYTWKVEDLNNVAIAAGLSPFTAGDVEVRIKSTLGSNQGMSAFSNPITLTITPYSTDLPKLVVPGNHQGWSDANNFESAPRIAASGFGQTDYEGYMWLDGEFKFLAPNAAGNFAWGNTDWGDDGSFAETLVVSDEQNCSAPAGYYRVRANTSTLTYSASSVNWGIIGAATPTGWDSDTDLTYNPTTKKLEIASIALVPGPFKFRGNNAWSNGFDLGTVNADGYLVDGGDLNFSGPAGNYKVILDLSNPRKYTYTLIAL